MNDRAQQLLELFFSERLSSEDAAELNLLLASDKDLAQEMTWRIQISRSASLAGKHHPLKKRLQNKKQSVSNTIRKRDIYLLSAVAAFLVLLLGGIHYFQAEGPVQQAEPSAIPLPDTKAPIPPDSTNQLGPKPDPTRIPAKTPVALKPSRLPLWNPDTVLQYFKPFPNRVNIRVAGEEGAVSAPLDDAFDFYDAREFGKAAELFKLVADSSAADPQLQLYYGAALVGDKQFERAIPVLLPLSQTGAEHQTPASFYLALAYTGTGQYDKAKERLNAVLADEENNAFFLKNAHNLLNQLF